MTKSLQNIVLEAVELEVAANPLLQKESPVNSKTSETVGFPWKWLVVIFLLPALARIAFIFQRRQRKQKSPQVTDKEKELFNRFQKASASHDAAVTMQALLYWLDYSEITGLLVVLHASSNWQMIQN